MVTWFLWILSIVLASYIVFSGTGKWFMKYKVTEIYIYKEPRLPRLVKFAVF